MMRRLLSTLLALVLLLHGTEGFSGGAPEGACKTLEPVGHTGARRNPTPNPYTIEAPHTAMPGDTVTVRVSGEQFKGYMIQAITPAGEIVGKFTGSTVTCDRPKDTATHNNPRTEFMPSATLQWKVPNINDQVHFRGTVVRDYDNYYINIYSNPMMVGPPLPAAAGAGLP